MFMVEPPGTAPGSYSMFELLQHCVIFIAQKIDSVNLENRYKEYIWL